MNDERSPDDKVLHHEAVPAAFDTSAAVYDRLVNRNPGYHKHLRLSAQRLHLPDSGAGMRLLDAGCGTGASTAALLSAAPRAEIVAFDASAGMLERARSKPWPTSVRFVHATMENLPAKIAGPFDAILAAYLLRNLTDIDQQLRVFSALLRPGGTLAVHEYSVRESWYARLKWNAVCGAVIIPAGTLVSGDASLYRYLRRSVLLFDGATQFEDRLRHNGFTAVRAEPMTGWQRGVVHTFVASTKTNGDAERLP